MLRLPTFDVLVRDPERAERYGVDPSVLAAWSMWHAQWQRHQRSHSDRCQGVEDLLARLLSTLHWLQEAFPHMVAFCWSLLHLSRERVERAREATSAESPPPSGDQVSFQALGNDAFSALIALRQARAVLEERLVGDLPRLHRQVMTTLETSPPTLAAVEAPWVQRCWAWDVVGLDTLLAGCLRLASGGEDGMARWPWLANAPWETGLFRGLYSDTTSRWAWPWNQHHREVEAAWRGKRQALLTWALARAQLHAAASQVQPMRGHDAWWTLGTLWLGLSSWWNTVQPVLCWWHGGTRRLRRAWMNVLRSDAANSGHVWATHVLGVDTASLDAVLEAPEFWRACALWLHLAPQFGWTVRDRLEGVLVHWLKERMLRPMLAWMWQPDARERARAHARKLQQWEGNAGVASIVHAHQDLRSLWSDTCLLSRCCLDGWGVLAAPEQLSAWVGAWGRVWSIWGEGDASSMGAEQQAMACAYLWGADLPYASMASVMVMPEREEGELLTMVGCLRPGQVVARLRAADDRYVDADDEAVVPLRCPEQWAGCTPLDATLARWGCRSLHQRLEGAWHRGCDAGAWSELAVWWDSLVGQPWWAWLSWSPSVAPWLPMVTALASSQPVDQQALSAYTRICQALQQLKRVPFAWAELHEALNGLEDPMAAMVLWSATPDRSVAFQQVWQRAWLKRLNTLERCDPAWGSGWCQHPAFAAHVPDVVSVDAAAWVDAMTLSLRGVLARSSPSLTQPLSEHCLDVLTTLEPFLCDAPVGSHLQRLCADALEQHADAMRWVAHHQAHQQALALGDTTTTLVAARSWLRFVEGVEEGSARWLTVCQQAMLDDYAERLHTVLESTSLGDVRLQQCLTCCVDVADSLDDQTSWGGRSTWLKCLRYVQRRYAHVSSLPHRWVLGLQQWLVNPADVDEPRWGDVGDVVLSVGLVPHATMTTLRRHWVHRHRGGCDVPALGDEAVASAGWLAWLARCFQEDRPRGTGGFYPPPARTCTDISRSMPRWQCVLQRVDKAMAHASGALGTLQFVASLSRLQQCLAESHRQLVDGAPPELQERLRALQADADVLSELARGGPTVLPPHVVPTRPVTEPGGKHARDHDRV